MLEKTNNRKNKTYTEFGYVNSDRNNATFIVNLFLNDSPHGYKFERISRKRAGEMCKKDVEHHYLFQYLHFLFALRKIIRG